MKQPHGLAAKESGGLCSETEAESNEDGSKIPGVGKAARQVQGRADAIRHRGSWRGGGRGLGNKAKKNGGDSLTYRPS